MDINEYIADLIDLRENYNDEIPSEILHSTSSSSPPRYKARKAWLSNVCGMVSLGITCRYGDLTTKEKFNSLCKTIDESHMNDISDYRITRGQIDLANEVLQAAIDSARRFDPRKLPQPTYISGFTVKRRATRKKVVA